MQNVFKNLYKINKTLRFELKPIGKTLESIEKNRVLERDQEKSQNRQKAKTILDEKVYIPIMEEKLATLSFLFDELNALLDAFENKNISKKEKDAVIKKMTDKIINLFKKAILHIRSIIIKKRANLV